MAKIINVKGPIVPDDYMDVYEWFGMEAVSPKTIHQGIAEAVAEGERELLVVINSGGGSVYAASEMYYALKKFDGIVNVEIPSIAASAASFLAMAGDSVGMSILAQFMIHGASTYGYGNHLDMSDTSEMLKTVDDAIINAYLTKTSKTREEIREMMNKDTYMNAQQALDAGFIDTILFDKPIEAVASADLTNQMLPIDVIEKVKADILAQRAAALEPTNSVDVPNTTDATNTVKDGEQPMDMEKLKNEHPELFNQVKKLGFEEGAKAENARLRDIDDLATPGTENLINDAKYGTPITAEQLAIKMIKAQREVGANHLSNAQQDAQHLEDVKPTATPEADNVTEQEQIAASLMDMWGGQTNG